MRGFITFMVGISGIAAACGGGGSGGGVITAEQADPICRTGCQYDLDCGNSTTPLETCVSQCVSTFEGWARRDALQSLVDCVTALPCNGSDDQCFLSIRPLAVHQQWEDRCRAQLQGCVQDIDQTCEIDPAARGDSAFFVFIGTPVMNELIGCLDEQPDCTTRQACVSSVLEAHNIRF